MAEQKNKQTLPKLVKLNLPEVEDFNDVISTLTITSSALEKKIAELFASTFSDFDGCKIVQTGVNEPLKCKLYFKPCLAKGEGLYAVKVRGEDVRTKKPSSFSAMVNTVNMLYNSKQFELENIAKEILADFINPGHDCVIVDRYDEELKKVVSIRMPRNWNNYLEEVADVIANTRFQNPYLAVTLDLTQLVAKLYGKKDPKEVKDLQPRGIIPKNKYQYATAIVKILNANTYIIEVKRIDIRALEELSQSIGYGSVSGTIVMTRA